MIDIVVHWMYNESVHMCTRMCVANNVANTMKPSIRRSFVYVCQLQNEALWVDIVVK